MLIYSGDISALVGGEDVLSVNWSARLECKLDFGKPGYTGPRSHLVWKVVEEEKSVSWVLAKARHGS